MAARLNPRHQEMVRQKIKASQLINALQDHVLKGKDLSRSQVTAALGLLKKCVPDLQSTELTGNEGGALQLTIKHYDFAQPMGSSTVSGEGLGSPASRNQA